MRCGTDVLTMYVQNALSMPWHDGAAFLLPIKTAPASNWSRSTGWSPASTGRK
ncbi:hypothetical protein [Salmonella enterica]